MNENSHEAPPDDLTAEERALSGACATSAGWFPQRLLAG